MQDVAGRGSVQAHLPDMYPLLLHAATDNINDVPRLHLQSGEAPPAVDGYWAREDCVQPLHLLPVEHAEADALRVRAAVAS